MKKFKILMGALVLSIFLSINGVSASNYRSLVGVSIPGFGGVYTTGGVNKHDNDSYGQYIKTIIALDTTGTEREIRAVVYGSGASYIVATKGSCRHLQDYNGYTTSTAGNPFKLRLKKSNNLATKTTYSGTWALDYNAMH